jgi:hypothetical protein
MAVSRILQSIYEAGFLNVSWGYRPNLKNVAKHVRRGYGDQN